MQDQGLSGAVAAQRLVEVGRNELAPPPGPSPWRLLLSQFVSPLVWLLAAACLVSALLGDLVDGIAIAAILVLNAVVGFFQEYRAEKAISALRQMTAPEARVVRDGATRLIPSWQVVPGDLLLLEAGDIVPADARLLEAHALTTNEAALTGESLPVERHDAVFMGTLVATGTARAEVTATGLRTEMGRIANLLATAETTETPLQTRLKRLGRTLLWLSVAVVAAVAALGLARGTPPFEVFLSAVSLAVAAVPEGLPTIVTIALAVGVRRMAARNVLVRKLPAVETLGCATVICTDKTGTLTTGHMTVRELWGPDPTRLLGAAAAVCDADLGPGEAGGVGDPTEIAILQAAAERGIDRGAIEATNPRVAVTPFDAATRKMSVLRQDGRLYVKGALEVLLAQAAGDRAEAERAAARMGTHGLRVLAVAVGRGSSGEQLELLGLIGIADPPRGDATAAVAAARAAGIRTVMITGDHPSTALAIGREMGIVGPDDRDASDWIHARATPEQKLELVRAWKSRGAVVAMTGDGVNDAPALREAHVGIAMGRGGTAVAREAAAIVLADDNFASIVAGIGEGRGIFDNIRKSLVYLLGGNTGELLLMLLAALAGLPTPLLPLQILWINLVTDGLPALALVLGRADPDALHHAPRPIDEPMLGSRQWRLVITTGLLLAGTTFAVFCWARARGDLALARTLTFTTLVIAHTVMTVAFAHPSKTLWQIGALSNRALASVVAGSVLTQLLITTSSAGQHLFRLAPVPNGLLAAAALVALVPVSGLETIKIARAALGRRRQRGG